MADLISPIENGQIVKNDTQTKKEDVAGGELGKDAFLQLLVTQMQNQDPLDPADNSEYIAQLTTFSQLEALQNIESSLGNSQALNLTGKFVDVTSKSSTGKTSVISGFVDYVTITSGKAYVVINGKSYLASEITTVYDEDFLKNLVNPDNNTGNTSKNDSVTGKDDVDSDTTGANTKTDN